jgi:tetratricopeptide (TPR) repeat protein
VRLLAQVMEREQTALELPLSALQHAEIAFPRRGTDLEYVFKHVTMREVAYNTLVQKRRQQLHLDTARAIATLYPSDEYVEIIAYHYRRTAEHGDAAVWLEKAGDRAAAIYANETAIENYEEAEKRCELAGEPPAVFARLDEKLGATYFIAGRNDEAIPVLERSVERNREVRDLEGAGRAAALLGRAMSDAGRTPEGLQRVEPLVELLAWNGPSPALASLHLTLGVLFQRLGRYEDMVEAAERTIEIARASGDDRLLARATERRGTALDFVGRPLEAKSALEEAIVLLEQVGDLERLMVALSNMGELHRLQGELHAARQFNERALAIGERMGNPTSVAFALMNLGEIHSSLGEWEETREYLDRASEVLAALASASFTAGYLPSIGGQISMVMGKWEEAQEELQRALDLGEQSGDRQLVENSQISLAELEVVRGEPEAAITRLEPLTGRDSGFRVLFETILAWALLEMGETTRAERLAGEAVERARHQGEILALVDALRVQGMVLGRQGKRNEAGGVLAEGLARARSMPYPYAEARILAEMGKQEEALVIFRRLGALKDVQRIEKLFNDRPGG